MSVWTPERLQAEDSAYFRRAAELVRLDREWRRKHGKRLHAPTPLSEGENAVSGQGEGQNGFLGEEGEKETEPRPQTS